MSKGFEGPRMRGTFYMGSRDKSRHLDASVEGRTQDFMSRNSLGSPTFMFYPVIMMSTYTPDKTKHYPSSFPSSLFRFNLSLSLPHLAVVIGIRPRRGNATHFCEEKSVQALTFILSLLFRQGDSGMPIDFPRRRAYLNCGCNFSSIDIDGVQS